jgi:hypothetical protein
MTTPQKFRKRPVEIEALRYTGTNAEAVRRWVYGDQAGAVPRYDGDELQIETLEGIMRADPGDWIIRGVAGEFYPCKPGIFEATYEAV